jgi:thiosulfate/3-mercaptopyruvate sulfurtransferase
MAPESPALPSALVSTQWLADHLGADGLLVVDASVASCRRPDGSIGYLSGHEQYLLEGHVPGAVFADLVDAFSDPDGPYPCTRRVADLFSAAAGALGVGADTTVVVYDTAVGQWASRLWWLFRAFGFDRVALLDGGLAKWRTEERELVLGHVTPSPAPFVATPRPELWVEKADVEAVVRGERDAALVCSSPPKEFTGEVAPRGRAGHIPGSSSVPAAFLVDREHNTVLDPDGLRARFEPALGAPRIITYCAGGIAAAASAFALTLLGERSVAIYDGSLNEWAADPEAPLVTA